MLKTIVYTLVVVMLLPLMLAAEDGSGGQPGTFRDLKLGGRASAMGGAYTALAEGGMGFLYNSAGSAQSRKNLFAFSYRAMHLDRRLGFVSYTIPAREQASLSLFWLYAGTKALTGRDNQGYETGENISWSENMLGANFSKQFGKMFSFGAKVFYAQSSIANINAYTAGVDFGGLGKFDMRKTFFGKYLPLLRVGLSTENIGANYRWTTTDYWTTQGQSQGSTFEESFPVNFRLGLALEQPNKYVLSADFELDTKSVFRSNFGGEINLNRMIALRAGLDDAHPTFGFGLFKVMSGFGMKIDMSYLLDKVGEGDDLLISFDLIF